MQGKHFLIFPYFFRVSLFPLPVFIAFSSISLFSSVSLITLIPQKMSRCSAAACSSSTLRALSSQSHNSRTCQAGFFLSLWQRQYLQCRYTRRAPLLPRHLSCPT